MGWIQQTKQASRKSGGPQYYLQGIGDGLKELLKARGACEVWLGTPYGVVLSGLTAVAGDKVLDGTKLRRGAVGHDRIQRQAAALSVGEQIKHWFDLRSASEPYRVDFIERTYKSAFLLIPTKVQFPGGRQKSLPVDLQPLTFTSNHQSRLLQRQIMGLRERPVALQWVTGQIARVVEDHVVHPQPHVKEEDLLRAGGALSYLGIQLSAYRGKGYDCADTVFHCAPYPPYRCAVEIKKVSSGFDYQILKKTHPARATVLCMTHDVGFTPPEVVDVIELSSLLKHLRAIA